MDPDVASTARVTAAWRAVETARAQRLFADPWAAALAGADVLTKLTSLPPEVQDRASSYTIIRTRNFDDWLLSMVGCAQIVLLGAGFDTRAFRLAWPVGTQIWELDQAQVLDAKEEILKGEQTSSGCTRHSVEADFADNAWSAALLRAAFRPDMPTAWLAEGLLPYLQPASVESLLHQVSGLSAAGSCLAADFVSADLMAARNAYVRQQTSPAGGAMFNFGVDDPSALLTDKGWRVTSLKQPGDDDASFGRWVQPQGVGAGFFFVMAEWPLLPTRAG